MAKRSKKQLFVLILVGILVNLGGCQFTIDENADTDSATTVAEDSDTADTDSGVDSDSTTEADSDSATSTHDSDTTMDTTSDSSTETDGCGAYDYIVEQYIVPSPEPGVAAEPAALCAVMESTALSNRAAHIVFDRVANDPIHVASGRILLASTLQGKNVTVAGIEIIQAVPIEATQAEFTEITQTDMGFSFKVNFPKNVFLNPGEAELTVKVTLQLECGTPQPSNQVVTPGAGPDTKLVEATTFIHLCSQTAMESLWVSSGDTCVVCGMVCEMAAPPLQDATNEGPLALIGSPTVEIVPDAVVGKKVFLHANHRYTSGEVSYQWRALSGRTADPRGNTVVWELDEKPESQLLQLVVQDDHTAAIATFTWRHRA